MVMSMNLKIAIAEPSPIVRYGMESLLKHLPGLKVQLIEIALGDALVDSLRMHRPDVLIINPILLGLKSVRHLREEAGCADTRCLALVTTLLDQGALSLYDEMVTLYDDTDDVRRKLEKPAVEGEEDDEPQGDEQQTLSAREKEIVVCVVKGMTNREIADQLFLSTHTVITHRRNIARKLQIHSASGLTVYAIVNKLVELGDIKQ